MNCQLQIQWLSDPKRSLAARSTAWPGQEWGTYHSFILRTSEDNHESIGDQGVTRNLPRYLDDHNQSGLQIRALTLLFISNTLPQIGTTLSWKLKPHYCGSRDCWLNVKYHRGEWEKVGIQWALKSTLRCALLPDTRESHVGKRLRGNPRLVEGEYRPPTSDPVQATEKDLVYRWATNF